MMKLLRRPGGRTGTSGPSGPACHHGHAIGLDFGATAVRVAVLSFPQRDGTRRVVADQLGGIALPPGTVVNGVVTDPPALTAALKELWRTADIGCRHVILGVASPQIQVRELKVPDLDPARRAQALPFQAREVIALPLDQVVLDFAALGGPDAETHLVNGLLVASPREPVMVAVAAVEAAGLKVARVDLASFAALRAVAEGGSSAEAVIDLGAHLTTVVVHQDGVPKLVRTLARGGEEITRQLAEQLKVGAQEAEQVKCRDGLSAPGPASLILQDLLAPFLTDIRTSINYFRSSHAGARIDQVSLTGGSALLPGLAEAVASQVGAPTSVATPGQLLDPTPRSKGQAPDPTWATAQSIGLAMGAAA